MSLGIIIQARMGSTRLPNKMVKPFYEGLGVFEILLERLIAEILDIPIIVATTTSEKDNQIARISKKKNIEVYRGSEHNVLERFIGAAESNGFEKLIRVCADNPFLDLNALKHQIKEFKKKKTDYWCYTTETGLPTIKTSYGFWGEGVTSLALQEIAATTNDSLYQEHVTNFIYAHPDKFSITKQIIPESVYTNSTIRLTIDTLEDFVVAQEVYKGLIKNKLLINQHTIVSYVKRNEKWMASMEQQQALNAK